MFWSRERYERLATDSTVFLVACLGTILWATHSAWTTTHELQSQTPIRDELPKQRCDDQVPQPLAQQSDNVWASLTVAEVVDIRKWLHNPERGLNLTSIETAIVTDNLLDVIELLAPNKDAALAYYNGTGPKPTRYAQATILFGGRKTPGVETLRVGPLPISSKTTVTALHDIFHRPIVPYNARHFVRLADWSAQTLGIDSNIVEDLFNGSYRGLPNDTLRLAGQGPMSFDGEFRRTWAQFIRNVPGGWLHPLPLWIYTDQSGTDAALWHVRKIVYHRQIFSSIEKLVEAYHDGTLTVIPQKDTSATNWTSRARRGPLRDLDLRPGPRMVTFGGPRFRVDQEKQFVSWMGWELYMGFGRDMGLSLWNIKFFGERIIYELSPQEAMAQYAGNDPRQSATAWGDSMFGMGALVHEMIPNYDCPHGAVFLAATTHSAAGSMTNPARSTGVVKDYVLVIRTISTVDYTFDYTFMLDGTLEVRVSASGYLQGGWWDSTNEGYGTRIHTHSMGSLHDHVINFKVDFDLVNERNSLVQKITKIEEVKHDWLDEDWGPTTLQQYIEERVIKTEDDSRLRYPPNVQGMISIVNQDEKNAWGVSRGYSIIAGNSAVHNTVVGSKRLLKNAGWAKDNVAVTRRKETEPRSSSMWNMNLPGAPTVEFDRFFDGESLEQEDIVAWINVGTHHFTQSEDVPNTRMNTASSSFVLSPLNFHDYDVSIGSANAVTMDFDGKSWIVDENDVKEPLCAPSPPPPVDYGNDVAFDVDGVAVHGGGAKWLRANVWPYIGGEVRLQ
ncbi:amine oxidase catalytic domain-containing protein [Auriculariales sp. MPI-PUGE-AT-0066]|nr:amine oxidase catalytic domain-containing protein [Auriculariales sp. MPI-PUGE-AT-0066]